MLIEEEFGTVEGATSGNYIENANYKGKVIFGNFGIRFFNGDTCEATIPVIELKEVKLGQMKPKGEINDKSKSKLRLTFPNDKIITVQIEGYECKKFDDVINWAKKVKKVEPPPTDSSIQLSNEEYTTSLKMKEQLFSGNPIANMFFQSRDELFPQKDLYDNFSDELVKYYINMKEREIGYSSQDKSAVEADTTAGANVRQYHLNEQSIRQMLRRRPQILKKYKEAEAKGKKEEFLKKDFMQLCTEQNAPDLPESAHDIIKFDDIARTKYQRDLDEHALCGSLADEDSHRGIYRKDELEPDQTIQLNEINTHSELVLAALGAIPDTTTDPDPTLFIKTPIRGTESLTDLEIPENEESDHLSVNKLSMQYEVCDRGAFVSALESFGSGLDSFIENFNPRLDADIDGAECSAVLREMTASAGDTKDYELVRPELLGLATKKAELQVMAFCFWTARERGSDKERERAEKIYQRIKIHRDQTERYVETHPLKDYLAPLLADMHQQYNAIIGCYEEVSREMYTGPVDSIMLL